MGDTEWRFISARRHGDQIIMMDLHFKSSAAAETRCIMICASASESFGRICALEGTQRRTPNSVPVAIHVVYSGERAASRCVRQQTSSLAQNGQRILSGDVNKSIW